MKPQVETVFPSPDWQGLAGPGRPRFRWSELLWSLIYPARNHRVRPTISGLVLIGLALGIGSAAYNAANNILFLVLSLLLACLILSGVMSWLNLRGVCWRLLLAPSLRAGRETTVTLELWNRKRRLPVYGLWFELGARALPATPPRAESTFTASSGAVRAAFARSDAAAAGGVVALRERLDPDGQARLDWSFTPARRGRVSVELAAVGSLFPFGFLRKSRGLRLRREALVWPAPVEYRLARAGAVGRTAEGERVSRPGAGSDLLSLRRFQPGDSHRLIHWKASARLRQLMFRQLAAERAEGFPLWVETPPGRWVREEQFELLCRFAATLAEDLFNAGRLTSVAVNDEEPIRTRRVRDLESFLDRLALLQPAENGGTGSGEAGRAKEDADGAGLAGAADAGSAPVRPSRRDFVRLPAITFAPEGARNVAAYLDGEKAATT